MTYTHLLPIMIITIVIIIISCQLFIVESFFHNNNNNNNLNTFIYYKSKNYCKTNIIITLTTKYNSIYWKKSALHSHSESEYVSQSIINNNNYVDKNNNNKKNYDLWNHTINSIGNPYRSSSLFPMNNNDTSDKEWNNFLYKLQYNTNQYNIFIDPFWEQIKNEAQQLLYIEPQSGPQLYQGILSQQNLLSSICTVIAHEIETELIQAIAIKKLFLELLTIEDEYYIRYDLQAVATRSPSIENAMDAILFHNGFHALVCYRVAHRLWVANRTGLAYYIQSVVSRTYSADIRPACILGYSLYIRVGGGVVIGETAIVGNDVSILEGVTLGGTGKEKGNRHPKISNGVIIYDGGTVLGNIIIGEGTIISPKCIATKQTPPLAIVSGVPGKIQNYRNISNANINTLLNDPLQEHLVHKYWKHWQNIASQDT